MVVLLFLATLLMGALVALLASMPTVRIVSSHDRPLTLGEGRVGVAHAVAEVPDAGRAGRPRRPSAPAPPAARAAA